MALDAACRENERVCLAFVLDPVLLRSDRVGAPIVQAFFSALGGLRDRLRQLGSDLALLEGDAAEQLRALAARIDATSVYYNEDYDPQAIARDETVARALRARGVQTHAFTDHVYFGAHEVVGKNGSPYKVFSPYCKRWLDQRNLGPRAPLPSAKAFASKALASATVGETRDVPTPEEYGHESSAAYPRVSESTAREMLERFLGPGGAVERYENDRNYPAIHGTSFLSPHLRAGTIGIRECVERAFTRADGAESHVRASLLAWIRQLIWRDFYQMVLCRFPHVATGPFLPSAAHIRWRNSDSDFAAWCQGRTGYPIVDAAMRQLNAGGWMHNRLRMIVASFLTKDLLIDWRRGERYFEQRLADADLAQNNGGWQWAASTGTDAAPYFRIFSPTRQSKTFDPSGAFVRRHVPELRDVSDAYIHEPWTMPPLLQAQMQCRIGTDYPAPIVDHGSARLRAIETFRAAMQ